MIVEATDDGVYRDGEPFCCRGRDVNDVFEDYVCAWEGLYRLPTEEKVDRRSCWRLVQLEGRLYASLEGPVLRDLAADKEVDLRWLTEELGWYSPHGPPHMTDVASFGDALVAAVEVGHMLTRPSLEELKPLRFKHDQHNLLPAGGLLLIATAGGIYYTRDLADFRLAQGGEGYAHALVSCGGRLYSHVMEDRPVMESEDGVRWRNIGVELPRPSFGTTGLGCAGEGVVYSTTSTYLLRGSRAERLWGPHPMTRRVISL
ncbi:hypothetical protein [Pyrobaculum sp.]|uniref:hypothetical protein n=1 Tax=Pyrobaculum sp. TaxID=2004705 RepID=UPI003D0BADD0